MMKTLCLIRHAKSSGKQGDLADIDRPLNRRGVRDAPAVGRQLRELDIHFDVLYASPAVRARETAALMLDGMGASRERCTIVDDLYATDPESILSFIRSRSNALDTIGLVIHNPEVTRVAGMLDTIPVESLPTGAVCVFSLEGEWSDLTPDTVHLTRFLHR